MEIGRMDRNMGMENGLHKTLNPMLEIGRKVKQTDKVPTYGKMVTDIQVTGLSV